MKTGNAITINLTVVINTENLQAQSKPKENLTEAENFKKSRPNKTCGIIE